ncbi:MAG: hypothetical protein K2K39_01975 [Clostridia bacterium]|nr:hypothetical protein [Clostridia bacterium]
MDSIDIYYRAFKDYRKETLKSSVCEKDRRAIATADIEQDRLVSTKYLVTIEDDWIKAIEDGLKFVEQAVGEERQFIKTNGEVVPIEKIRKISKDTVVHLAKHSDMITHVPEEEGATIVPDQLYMVEKLSDYGVYENRFLYMMLCYLKNFIEFRLEKIDNLRRSYVGDMGIKKKIAAKKRTLSIEVNVYEERADNPYPIPDEKCDKLVRRISDCREIINALLNTDLMQQVAKTPMIKPPIVKTNVLKMNNNFKNALALYDYIASYDGDGFSYEEVKNDFAPYREGLADELAEATNLVTFISYKAGNKLDEVLELNYREEEARRRREEEQKLVQQLNRLKKRAAESGKSLEEYMLVLEERNRRLEKDSEELANIKLQMEQLLRQIEALNAEKEELNRRIGELQRTIELKEQEIEELKRQYIEDMAALKNEHAAEISRIKNERQDEIERLKAEFADKMTETIDGYESRVSELNSQLYELNVKYDTTVSECDKRIADMQFAMTDYENEKKRLTDELDEKLRQTEKRCEEAINTERAASDAKKVELEERISKLTEEASLAKGELDGIRIQQGKLVPSTEYTSRERFTELEQEYEAFQKFFKKQWEFTKKEIRKSILWAKDEKKPRE